jgi:hypothetical protein
MLLLHSRDLKTTWHAPQPVIIRSATNPSPTVLRLMTNGSSKVLGIAQIDFPICRPVSEPSSHLTAHHQRHRPLAILLQISMTFLRRSRQKRFDLGRMLLQSMSVEGRCKLCMFQFLKLIKLPRRIVIRHMVDRHDQFEPIRLQRQTLVFQILRAKDIP